MTATMLAICQNSSALAKGRATDPPLSQDIEQSAELFWRLAELIATRYKSYIRHISKMLESYALYAKSNNKLCPEVDNTILRQRVCSFECIKISVICEL